MNPDDSRIPDLGPIPFRFSRNRRIAAIATVVMLLAFAGFFRWAFGTDIMSRSGGVVSLSFIMMVPFAVGALSVAIGRWFGSDEWATYSTTIPAAVMILALFVCLITRIEAAICVIMAAPILLLGTFIGGLFAHLVLPLNRNDFRLRVTFAVFLPFVVAAIEGRLRWPIEIKAIESTIEIAASPEAIWSEIASVRAIAREEIPDRWIYWVDFPRPIAATLDREHVGGIRTATFERGVSFTEVVTEWDPPRRLAFSIHADPEFIPHTAFDRHIIVGGRFYDVLDGIYEIEPLPGGGCRIHLTSHHRLSTRFNAYAAWWSERVMDQIQGSILHVIRERAQGRGRLSSLKEAL